MEFLNKKIRVDFLLFPLHMTMGVARAYVAVSTAVPMSSGRWARTRALASTSSLGRIEWLKLPANLALPYLRNRKIVYGDLNDYKMRIDERTRFDPIMSVP